MRSPCSLVWRDTFLIWTQTPELCRKVASRLITPSTFLSFHFINASQSEYLFVTSQAAVMKSLPYFLATCLPLTHAIACYNPGDTIPNPFLTPCNNETSFSTCCRAQETCLPNGLCENVQIDNGTTTYTYFREGCTDPSWNSPSCLTPLNTCPNVRVSILQSRGHTNQSHLGRKRERRTR